MDVLYYIGNGSMRHNIELRFSLRSLEKFGKNIDRVFIIGNKPEFIKNVEYYWVEDKNEWWKNAFIKTKTAIEKGITEDFLLMNDDFFMLADFDAETYPFYHRGEIPDDNGRDYQKVIANTKRILQSENATTKHYGVHCPIRINGKKYLTLEKYYKEPVSARCLYGNLFCKGRKVTDPKGSELKENATKCWSSKTWLDDETLNKLREMFPNPSKYEKEDF